MDDNKDYLIKQIRSTEFFSVLSEDEVIQLIPHTEKIMLLQEEVLFNQGDDPDYVYIVLSGELLVFLKKAHEEIVIVNMINAHESVGELGALSGEPRTLTVKAISDASLLKVPSSIFKNLVINHPELSSHVYNLIIKRSTQTLSLIDKKLAHVSLIYNIVKYTTFSKIKTYFQHYLERYNKEVLLLSTDEYTNEEIFNIIQNAEMKKQSVIILLEKWDELLFKPIRNKLSHYYLLAYDGEKRFRESDVQEIINSVKHIPNVRIELILFLSEKQKLADVSRYYTLAHFVLCHKVRIGNDNDFERLARFMTGNATGLVLGGGGAKGLVHLGVIKSILEHKIPIDAIGGTSVGAVIGAFYAITENYTQALNYTRKLRFASKRTLKFRKLSWPVISIFGGNPVTNFLKDIFDNYNIEDLPLHYFAISSNFDKKIEKMHRIGLIWQAARATASIPGLVPPFVFNGELLFDGGLLNNLPVDRMREMIGEKHTVIAASLANTRGSNIVYNFPPALSFIETFLTRFKLSSNNFVYPPLLQTFMESMLLGSYAKEEHNVTLADVHIEPNLFGIKTLSSNEKDENQLLEIGYKEMNTALERYLIKNRGQQ